MANPFTGADAIRVFLTGAAIDNGYQGDPAKSLGLYRSSALAESLTVRRQYPIQNIQIIYAAGYNGPGLGVLTASGVNALQWTPPLGTQGPAVTITNGQTMQIPDSTGNKYIVVTRITADDLAGSETVILADTYNNVVGGSDFTSAQAVAGTSKYRAVMFENLSALAITALTVWLDTGNGTNYKIASQAPTANALTDETTNGELTQPGGLSWVSPTTSGTGVVIGTVAAAGMYGLWLDPYCGAGASCNPRLTGIINYSFVYSGVTYTGQLRGLHRIANAASALYQLFDGVDTLPNVQGSPTATSASLPATLAVSSGHTHNLQCEYQNQFGLASIVLAPTAIRVAASGAQTAAQPAPPRSVTVSPGPAGVFLVNATYSPAQDGASPTDPALGADTWAIYLRADGTSPDLVNDVPVTVAMKQNGFLEGLAYISAAYIDGAPAQCVVRTRKTFTSITDLSPLKLVATITQTAGTATVTLPGHGYTTGQVVAHSGAAQSGYNVTAAVTVVDANTYTYAVAGGTPSPATGAPQLYAQRAQVITRSGTTATVNAPGHGRVTGDVMTISGATQTAYNVSATITVVDANTFTYTVAGSPATPATGDITIQLTTPQHSDSSNTTIYTATAAYDGPNKLTGAVMQGRSAGLQQVPDAWGGNITTYIDQPNNIYWLQKSGELQLWANTVLCFRLRYASNMPTTNGFGYFFNIDETISFSGAGSATAAEVLSWTGGDKRISINVNGMRQMLFDVTNSQISFARRDRTVAPPLSASAEPAHRMFSATTFQVWDPATQSYAAPASIQSDGTLRLAVPLNRAADQAGVLA